MISRRVLPMQSLGGVLGLLLALPAGRVIAQQVVPTDSSPSIYTVSKYDPQRDAKQDLVTTVKRAKAGNKHILLEIGGDW